MRYVGLIAIVNFLALLFVDDVVGYSLVGGAFGATLIVLFGIPAAIIVGFPILWVARRIKSGSALVLIPLGAFAGAGTAFLTSTLIGLPSTKPMVVVGVGLGTLSSTLWWALVERWPDLRAYYD